MAEPDLRTRDIITEDAQNAMIAQTLELSDLSPAAPLSVMAGVWGSEFQSLQAALLVSAESFYFTSSSGAALDRRMADWGLTRSAATTTYGPVIFTRLTEQNGAPPGTDAAVISIPLGYQVGARDSAGNSITFVTRAQVDIQVGDATATGTVDATAVGTDSNVGSNAITELLGGAIVGLASASNRVAFTTGKDQATDAEARQQVKDFLTARSRGTVAAVRYGALTYSETVEGRTVYPVISAAVEEHLDAAGADGQAVTVWLAGVNEDPLTAAQLTAVGQRLTGYVDPQGVEIEGWADAGIPTVVKQAERLAVDITVEVTLSMDGSAATLARLKTLLEVFVASMQGGRTLYLKDITDQIATLGTEILDAKVTEPAANVVATINQKFVPGTVTVSSV